MARLTKCKGCGEEISKKAKSCPKCGEPIKRTHWFTWLVLLGFILYAIMPKPTEEDMKRAEAKFQAQPKQVAKRGLSLDFQWQKSGFGSVLLADFTIKNDSNYTVKDIEIRCDHYANSGTKIDSNTRVVYEIIEKHSTKKIKNINMGLIRSQITKSGCGIIDFKLVEE